MESVNASNVISTAAMLILVTLAFAVVAYGVVSLVYKLVMLAYEWLSHRAFFVRLRQKRQQWWHRHKVSAAWWWESTAIVFIDPVFYGYALVALVQRLQAIQAYGQTHQEYSFWQLLDLDSSVHMQYYIAFAVIFLIWMFWKIYQHAHDVRFERDTNAKLDKLIESNKTLSDSIKQNSEDIRQLIKAVEKLVEEIGKEREEKHGGSPNDM